MKKLLLLIACAAVMASCQKDAETPTKESTGISETKSVVTEKFIEFDWILTNFNTAGDLGVQIRYLEFKDSNNNSLFFEDADPEFPDNYFYGWLNSPDDVSYRPIYADYSFDWDNLQSINICIDHLEHFEEPASQFFIGFLMSEGGSSLVINTIKRGKITYPQSQILSLDMSSISLVGNYIYVYLAMEAWEVYPNIPSAGDL